MNHNRMLPFLAALALSIFVILGGVFFVSNTAQAYSICKSIDNKLVCETSPDQVCNFYGPNSVVCGSRTPDMPSG
ncbi:MAG: hypothetical protein M3247_09035 [Thermoproteota archaeon]|nr:hypothetical protein [Thermoproteota archaeon]